MNVGITNSLTSLEKKIRPVEYIAGENRHLRAKASEQDKAEMSNYGRNVSRLYDLISTVPDVRDSRVDEAILAVKNGASYNVKAEHVAEKIMKGDFLDEIF